MKFIGAHVSAAGGVDQAPLRATEIGANAFALFTKNQKQWVGKPLEPAECERFKRVCAEHGFSADAILPHDSYLINLAAADEAKRDQSLRAFADELKRCEALGLKYLNFHPGSHLNALSIEAALDRVAEGVSLALRETATVKAVIENTAGQGTNLGFELAHLARIIAQVDQPDRVGVCIDTCHAFAAGYDLSTEAGSAAFWETFDREIGFSRLCGMHLNDAMKTCNSRVDRHAPLGKGALGLTPFCYVMRQKVFDGIPLILETPEPEHWADEIRLLRSFEA